jgi:hypothetical protein
MGNPPRRFGHFAPWGTRRSRGILIGMTSPEPLRNAVSALVDAAQAFDRAAEARGSHRAAPESLAALQEAQQALSAGWYRLAADAGASMSRGDLSREEEVRLIGALQDVAAAFARSARACRDGRSAVAPVIARRLLAEPSWFTSREASSASAASVMK